MATTNNNSDFNNGFSQEIISIPHMSILDILLQQVITPQRGMNFCLALLNLDYENHEFNFLRELTYMVAIQITLDTNNDEAVLISNEDKWTRFMSYVLIGTSSTNTTPEFLMMYQDGNKMLLNARLTIGWRHYLLSNSGMHSTNGNIDSVNQRRHHLADDTFLEPQSFRVIHDLKWTAGDNALKGVCNWLGFDKQKAESMDTSFKSCKDEGFDIMSFLTDSNTILILLIASILIFLQFQTPTTRYLLCATIGVIMFLKATQDHFEKLEMLDLHAAWTLTQQAADVDMEPVFEAQSFTFDTPLMAKLLLTCLSLLSGYQVKQSFLNGLMSCTKVSESQTTNVTSMIMWVSTAIHNFLNSIEAQDLAKYFEIDAIGDDRVSKYQERVVQFVASFNSGNPESMLFCMDVYKTLYDEGRQLDATLDKRSYDHRVVQDCYNKLVSIYQKIEELKLSLNGERIEPVGILLRGEPSTMKGVLTKRIARVIALATLPNEWKPAYLQASKDFFFSVPKDQFWDGYSNKAWITFYDDIFQRRDAVADTDADALKVIDMINGAPYTLKMATISQKNNVFFRSAFVIANTNLSTFKNLNSVTDYKAVQRRFHIEVEVKVNPKYLVNGVMDTDTLPFSLDIENAKNIPNDFWDLTVIEKDGMKVSRGRNVTVKELIAMSVARHHTHRRNFYSNRKAEDRLVEELADEMGYNWSDSLNQNVVWEYEAQSAVFPSPSYKTLMKFFNELPYYELARYDNAWWHFCSSIERSDLGLENFNVILKSIIHHDMDVSEMVLVMHDPLALVSMLSPIVTDSLEAGFNPITKQPEWTGWETPKETPLDKLKEVFSFFLDYLKKNWMLILFGLLFSAGTLKALSMFFSSFFGGFDAQSVDFKTMGKRNVGKKTTIKLSSKLANRPKVESQSGVPIDFKFEGLPKFSSMDFGIRNNHNDVTAKIFNKSFFIAYVIENGNDSMEVTRLGHAINVVGQLFLMPMHYVYVLDALRKRKTYKGATIILVTSSGSNRYTIPLEEVLLNFRSTDTAADKDVCLVKVDCAQRMAKGCLESFLTNRDLKNLLRTTSFSAHLIGSYHPANSTSNISIRNHYVRAALNKGGMTVTANWDSDKFVYNLFDNFMYDISCSNGDCGSLLLASESNYENRIICGMHVAGGSEHGISVCITREMIDDLISHTFANEAYSLEDELPSFLENLDIVESQGSMVPLYKIKTSHVPGEVFKSEIRKSRLYSKLPPPFDRVNTLPAKIKPFYSEDGSLIDPLLKAFNKYGKIAPDIPVDLVSSAVESYENLINNHFDSDQADRNVIELKTALHSFDRINSISSSTSSGFPMSLPNEEDLKKEYFTAIEKRDVIEENRVYQRIATLVENTLNRYRSGYRPFFAYKQCGKDETREVFKVLEGKTRLFSACPFILLAMFRMYFGAFVNDFVKANSDIGSAVGVNPYSDEWDKIARKLLQFSESDEDATVAAGDQGQFDTRQWIIIHNAILDMINRYYGNRPEENFIRACLFKEITNSRHVFRGIIYEWNSGLPSGNPLTAIINTIYNNIVFRMSWGIAGLPIKEFNDSVYLIVLGDDNGFSVAAQYREVFNELTLPKFMDEIGMEYTTELKGDAVFAFRKLSDIEFLKRSFKKDKQLNRWIAPLRESAIAEMLNWTKKGKEGNQITLDNMCFALREFALHGKKKFEFWRDAIVNLKQELFPYMVPHGDMPLNYENTYKTVLNLEYYF